MSASRTVLIPRTSRVFPDAATRQENADRVEMYAKSRFNCYEDWFFFTHIDPVQRVLHGLGMVSGSLLFLAAFVIWNEWSPVVWLSGLFCFYVVGLISHLVYDKFTAYSRPDNFHRTLLPVIGINLRSVFGGYDPLLREFVARYPWVVDAWGLTEMRRRDVWPHVMQRVRKGDVRNGLSQRG